MFPIEENQLKTSVNTGLQDVSRQEANDNLEVTEAVMEPPYTEAIGT